MICRSDDQFFGEWVTKILAIELPIFWRTNDQFFGESLTKILVRMNDQCCRRLSYQFFGEPTTNFLVISESGQFFGEWVTKILANQRPIFWSEWFVVPTTNFLAIELPIFWSLSCRDQFFGPNDCPITKILVLFIRIWKNAFSPRTFGPLW